MQSSYVSRFSDLPTACVVLGGCVCVAWKTSMTVSNKSMTPPGVVKWSAMDFQHGVLTLGVGVCLHGLRAPSCHEIWAAGSSPKWEKGPPYFCVWTVSNPTVETWVLCPRITSRSRRWADSSACWASEGETRILVCVNSRRKQKP